MLHSVSLRFGVQVLTPMFRSSSHILVKQKSRRDVSNTILSHAPANHHWSTWAAEPGTGKASAAPKMKQKQSQAKGRKSSSVILVTRMENETYRNKGKTWWHWSRTERPADPYSPVGEGWVLPLCSPLECTSHFSQPKKIPPSLHSHPYHALSGKTPG